MTRLLGSSRLLFDFIVKIKKVLQMLCLQDSFHGIGNCSNVGEIEANLHCKFA